MSNVFCLASLPLSNSSESGPPAHRGLSSFALLSSCMPGLGTRPPPDPSSPLPRSNNRSGTCDPPTRALIPSPRSASSCARAPACDFGLADPDASETPPRWCPGRVEAFPEVGGSAESVFPPFSLPSPYLQAFAPQGPRGEHKARSDRCPKTWTLLQSNSNVSTSMPRISWCSLLAELRSRCVRRNKQRRASAEIIL